jgi:hypothetical protein
MAETQLGDETKEAVIKCPIYGYAFVDHPRFKILTDQKYKNCPLLGGLNCSMEENEEEPCWETCALRIANEERKDTLLVKIAQARVFPMRYRDKEYYKGWKGLPFEVWKNNILEGTEIPEEYFK